MGKNDEAFLENGVKKAEENDNNGGYLYGAEYRAKVEESEKETLWGLIITGLLGLVIGVYFGYRGYSWIGAVGGGIVGFIGGEIFYALSGGSSRPHYKPRPRSRQKNKD